MDRVPGSRLFGKGISAGTLVSSGGVFFGMVGFSFCVGVDEKYGLVDVVFGDGVEELGRD